MRIWGFDQDGTRARAYVVLVILFQCVHHVFGDNAPCSTPCGANSFQDASGEYLFDGTNFSAMSSSQCAVCAWRPGKHACQHPATKIAARGEHRFLCCALLEGFCREPVAFDERQSSAQGESDLANWIISRSSWISEKIISHVQAVSEMVIACVALSHEAVVWGASAATDFFWPQSDLLAFFWALCDWRTWLGITVLSLFFYKTFRKQVQSAFKAYQEEDPLDALQQWERWCERGQLRDDEYWSLVLPPGAIRRFDADQSPKSSLLMLDGIKERMNSFVATSTRVKREVKHRLRKTGSTDSESELASDTDADGCVTKSSPMTLYKSQEPPASPPTPSPPRRVVSSPQRVGRTSTGGRRRIRFEIHPEALDACSKPMLCFCNPASGGKQGDHVMNKLSQLLNPMQVYNLRKCNPAEILQWFLDGFGSKLRILVAGGDGTVGWVFSIFDELATNGKLQCRPPVAILPLGTGNDMARVMGWGGGYTGSSMKAILAAIASATPTYLDRWQAELTLPTSVERHPYFFHLKGKSRVNFTNYFGVGVDAEVVNNFHELRNHRPQLFWNRWVNRFHYGWMGVLSSARRSCVNLQRHLTVTCDGVLYELDTDVEGVIISNIASYAGGVTLWCNEPDHTPKASQQDGMVDVVLVKGSDHLGWIQLGFDKAVKLCQAHTVEITSRVPLPMHADGEPWIQPPSRLLVTAKGCQEVLLKRNVSNGEAEFVTVLEWAIGENVITAEQKQVLVQEMSKRAEAKVVHRDPARSKTPLKRVVSGTFEALFGPSNRSME